MFNLASCGCFLIMDAMAAFVGLDHFAFYLRGGCYAGINC